MKIFTNGCFDILHLGHIKFLKQAKELGHLTIGLNTDESIRSLKGPSRPIHAFDYRKQMLLELGLADEVVELNDTLPCDLIAELKPDLVVKGKGYTKENMPEAKIVDEYGGKIVFLLDYPEVNISTTNIVERITCLTNSPDHANGAHKHPAIAKACMADNGEKLPSDSLLNIQHAQIVKPNTTGSERPMSFITGLSTWGTKIFSGILTFGCSCANRVTTPFRHKGDK